MARALLLGLLLACGGPLAAEAAPVAAERPDDPAKSLAAKLTQPGRAARLEACAALGRMGPAAASAVRALVATLKDRRSGVGLHAAAALWQIGPAGHEALLALQNDPDVAVRQAAEAVLATQSGSPEKPLNFLIERLSSEDWQERDAASRALVSVGGEAVLPVLEVRQEKVRDPEVQARLGRVIAGIRLAAFNGSFRQVRNTCGGTNANAAATLVIEGGRATWTQHYSGEYAVQVYSFTPEQVRPVQDGADVAITFEKLDSDSPSYRSDSVNTVLHFRGAEGGWNLSFDYTDTGGSSGRVDYVPLDQEGKKP